LDHHRHFRPVYRTGVFEALLADLFNRVPRKFESPVDMRFAIDHADDLEAHAVCA
jgi:hypothetical protein